MPVAEGEVALSPYNKLAGEQLKAFREMLRPVPIQEEFGRLLSARLGFQMKKSTISAYEHGRRAVPAAVLLAAQSYAMEHRGGGAAEAGEASLTGGAMLKLLVQHSARIDEMEKQMARLRHSLEGIDDSPPPPHA